MKKAGIIIVLVVLLTATTALAADSVLYSDDELGFSFEMPGDFEYYGDVSAETAEIIEAEKASKQPMYIGYDSNISVTYSHVMEELEPLKKGMPEGMAEEEFDYYLIPKKNKEGVEKDMMDEIQNLGMEYEVLSSEWVDFGGKLGLYVMLKGHNSDLGMDFYQTSLNFLYKDHAIAITYTKFNFDGTLTSDDAKAQFDESFNTLEFDIVPSDKNAELSLGITIDWKEAAVKGAIGGVTAAVVGLIVYLINRSKKKKQREE